MGRPIRLTSTSLSIDYFRICDREGICHVVKGMRKVQLRIEQMPELLVTKLPPHWSAEPAAEIVGGNAGFL